MPPIVNFPTLVKDALEIFGALFANERSRQSCWWTSPPRAWRRFSSMELFQTLQELRADQALSIVLVEQNTRLALDLAPSTVVMDRGRIV